MESLLSKLSYSDQSRRTANADPVLQLRRKATTSLDHQICGAIAELKGETYTIQIEKWALTDKANGTKERVKVQKALRRMWYYGANGEAFIELRFANKSVAIHDKPSIVCSKETLVETLQVLRKAILLGELDAQLKATADSRKRTLKLPKKPATAPAPKAGK